MDLRPGPHPPEGDTSILALVSATYVANGILFRALVELKKTPKPWPTNIKRGINALAVALAGQRRAYLATPQALREAATGWSEETD